MPPRDVDGVAIRRTTVPASSIEAFSFAHRIDVSVGDRLFYGAWEGLRAHAFIKFHPDSFRTSTEGDTLAGAVVLDAALVFNCVPGQGGDALPVVLAGVVPGAANAWEEDSLRWPGPALSDLRTEATLESCESGDDFPEREIEVPPALIEAWIADREANNGVALVPRVGSARDAGAFGDPGALLQLASSENNFAFIDSIGTSIVRPPGPRIRFRAALDGGAGDTVSVFRAETSVTGDVHVVAPDSADIPCADPGDCLEIGRGASHRSVFRLDLPDLPRGSNIHQAILRLNGLGHPRFDAALGLEVYRLTSAWTGEAPIDSLVETSGVLWHTATLDSAGTSVSIPVTNLVQAWYDGVYENDGFLVRASREDASATTESFASPTYPTEALRPVVEIAYTTPLDGRP
jgi:hypothetical protein